MEFLSAILGDRFGYVEESSFDKKTRGYRARGTRVAARMCNHLRRLHQRTKPMARGRRTSRPEVTMSAKRGLGKGLDAKLFAVGMGFLALGAAGAYVGLFTRFGVRIGSIPIPLSIVGPAVALVGLVVLALSFRQEKCLDCGAALDIHLAAFDPSAERYVVASAAALDAAALDALPVGTHAGPNVQVSLQPCPKCRQIAKLEVSAFRPSREALLPPRVVTGPALARFIDVVAARAAAHEKTYDDATA